MAAAANAVAEAEAAEAEAEAPAQGGAPRAQAQPQLLLRSPPGAPGAPPRLSCSHGPDSADGDPELRQQYP